MSEALTVIQTDHGEVKLTPTTVRKYLVNGQGNVSDQEVTMFIAMCKFQKLNPFLREAYLIKFGNEPATMVTGKDVFTKRASKIEKCLGWNAGVITIDADNKVIKRPGTLVLPGETLVGGWCTVHRQGWSLPLENEVSLSEYMRYKKDGTVVSNWKNMPGTMIRKVALVQALRDTFPEYLEGMYSPEEMDVDSSKIDTKVISQEEIKDKESVVAVYDDGDPALPWNTPAEEIKTDKITSTKVQTLKGLFKTSADEKQLCEFLEIDSIENLTESMFVKAMKFMEAKTSKVQSVKQELDI